MHRGQPFLVAGLDANGLVERGQGQVISVHMQVRETQAQPCFGIFGIQADGLLVGLRGGFEVLAGKLSPPSFMRAATDVGCKVTAFSKSF